MELFRGWRGQEREKVRLYGGTWEDPGLTAPLCRFLGYVDLKGTTYQSSTIATGYGSMIGQPLLRKAVEGKEDTLTEEEAKEIVEKVMKVLFYRDARSLNKVSAYFDLLVVSIYENFPQITLAKITEEGVTISEPYSLPTDWTVGTMVRGYGSG